MINLPGCSVLPPGVTKIFQFQRIQRFDKSDTDISDLIIDCFSQEKSCQKLYFKQLIFHDKFHILHCSSSGTIQI